MKLIPVGNGMFAKVDDEDYERIILHCKTWRAHRRRHTFYAFGYRTINGKPTFDRMHRVVMGITDSEILIDHVDGDGLNNQKSNLRIATEVQNHANMRKWNTNSASRFKGVYKGYGGQWRAAISQNNRTVCLGTFQTEEEAARAYDVKARELHGEFARTNFQEGEK